MRLKKRAFNVAEQFGLDEIMRNGSAVDTDKWLGRARALGVEGCSNQFFSCSALTFNQHRCVRRRRGTYRVMDPANPQVASNHAKQLAANCQSALK